MLSRKRSCALLTTSCLSGTCEASVPSMSDDGERSQPGRPLLLTESSNPDELKITPSSFPLPPAPRRLPPGLLKTATIDGNTGFLLSRNHVWGRIVVSDAHGVRGCSREEEARRGRAAVQAVRARHRRNWSVSPVPFYQSQSAGSASWPKLEHRRQWRWMGWRQEGGWTC